MDAQKETRIMYILDERGELREIEREKAVPVEHPIKYRIKNAFEVFVRVDGTENYWISNYGRCVNNYNYIDKTSFYEHKTGDVHYTLFAIEKRIIKQRGKEVPIEEKSRIETSPAELVAKHFLHRYNGRNKIWHKDRNLDNNWYKNLIWISDKDYRNLMSGKVTLEELNLEQEYIEFQNKASHEAMKKYGAIKTRCDKTKKYDNIHKCYDDVTMWQGWIDEPKSFVRWYLENYYEVDGEEMVIDKDLFSGKSKIYSPDTCCILPQTINVLLTNCQKHYFENGENGLPLGISRSRDGYYGTIQFTGTGKRMKLSEWSTPEEAFAEYKVMKEADFRMVVAKYIDKIPRYIYEKLINLEIEPY